MLKIGQFIDAKHKHACIGKTKANIPFSLLPWCCHNGSSIPKTKSTKYSLQSALVYSVYNYTAKWLG